MNYYVSDAAAPDVADIPPLSNRCEEDRSPALLGSRKLVVTLLCLLVLSWSTMILSAVEGVVVYGSRVNQPASGWVAVEYDSFRQVGAVTKFRAANGAQFEVTKFQPKLILPYIDLNKPGLEIRSSMAAHWKGEYNRYKDSYNTYPKSRVYLKSEVYKLGELSSKLSKGFALFEGEWVKDSEVDGIIAKRKNEALRELKEKKFAEKKALIEEAVTSKKAQLDAVRDKIKIMKQELSDKQEQQRDLEESIARRSKQLNEDIKNTLGGDK